MINGNKKLTYLNNLWMYFDEITDRFNLNRNKIKDIYKILKQKNEMEKKYSSNIKKLCDEYTIKYNNKNDIETPCDSAINKIVDILKEEAKLIEEKTKYLSSDLIMSLNSLAKSQISISKEILKIMEASSSDYKLINQLLREKELNLTKIGKDLEAAMYNLEMANLDFYNQKEVNIQNNKKNENENNKNNEDNNKEEINSNKKDIIESYQKTKQKKMLKAKEIKFEYESFIKIANKEREKYVNISSKIYNDFQLLDENFIKKIKEIFKNILEKEINSINKILEIKDNFLKKCVNLIDIDNDINIFTNSKIIKFNIPTEIKCLCFSPQLVLKNQDDPIKSKISEKINNELNSFFLNNKKKENKENKEKNNIFTFIDESVSLIREQKKYDKDKLMKLLEFKENRKKFFENLNYFRNEGFFNLAQKTFDDLSFLFNYLIKYAIKDKDYDSFKSLIILSQTFYLNTNKDLFLNSSIESNDIWKNKQFWEEIIEYSINDELNNSRDFYIFLGENSETRKERINSSITSNIITYLYNMKLLKYPEEKYKELIDDLVKKYKIDGTNIYATLNSINNAIEIENNINNH